MSALLEEADGQFGTAVQALDSYKLHYGAYMNEEQLAHEVEILTTVLDNEPSPEKKAVDALRLAQVANATGNWARIEELLKPYTEVAGDYRFEVLAEHGHALCRLNRDRPHDPGFIQGRMEIEEAAKTTQKDLRTRVLAYRAWASSRIPNNEQESRENYRTAHEADPKNPFHLASHIEYELYCGEPFGLPAMTRPVLLDAIAICRAYADARIELPWAFLTMGRLFLLADDFYESLAAYAKAIRLCLIGVGSTPKDVFDTELEFLRHINRPGHAMPEQHDWVRRLLLLAKMAQGSPLAGHHYGETQRV